MRYFIYVTYYSDAECTNVTDPLQDQPRQGFESYEKAEEFLIEKIESGTGDYFNTPGYNFFILKTYQSK